tara:strand:+ start:89 stop:520 length:432 start_codon:yes stop_codon:yes gene_type:complete
MKFMHTLELIDGRYYDADEVDDFLDGLDEDVRETAPVRPMVIAEHIVTYVRDGTHTALNQQAFHAGMLVQFADVLASSPTSVNRCMNPDGYVVLATSAADAFHEKFGTGNLTATVSVLGVNDGRAYVPHYSTICKVRRVVVVR